MLLRLSLSLTGYFIVAGEWVVGDCCDVMDGDGRWYPARVVSTKRAAGQEVRSGPGTKGGIIFFV